MKYRKKSKNSNQEYFEFNTMHEIADFVAENKYNTNEFFKNRSNDLSSLRTNSKRGFNLIGFDESVEFLKNGWDEGSKKLKNATKIANSNQQTFRSEYNVVGGNCSVPRYLQGIPTNMILQKRIEKKQKLVNVYKSVGYSSMWSADQILVEARKLIEIVQQIELNGYRTNIYVLLGADGRRDEKVCVKLKVKSSNERLNLKKISFSLMHPDFLRRILLKLIEIDPIAINGSWDAYGYPLDNEGNVREKYSEIFNFEKNDVFVPIKVENIDKFIKSLNI